MDWKSLDLSLQTLDVEDLAEPDGSGQQFMPVLDELHGYLSGEPLVVVEGERAVLVWISPTGRMILRLSGVVVQRSGKPRSEWLPSALGSVGVVRNSRLLGATADSWVESHLSDHDWAATAHWLVNYQDSGGNRRSFECLAAKFVGYVFVEDQSDFPWSSVELF